MPWYFQDILNYIERIIIQNKLFYLYETNSLFHSIIEHTKIHNGSGYHSSTLARMHTGNSRMSARVYLLIHWRASKWGSSSGASLPVLAATRRPMAKSRIAVDRLPMFSKEGSSGVCGHQAGAGLCFNMQMSTRQWRHLPERKFKLFLFQDMYYVWETSSIFH